MHNWFRNRPTLSGYRIPQIFLIARGGRTDPLDPPHHSCIIAYKYISVSYTHLDVYKRQDLWSPIHPLMTMKGFVRIGRDLG